MSVGGVEGLRVEVKRRTTFVTLDRPAQLNPFSFEILGALRELFAEFDSRGDISVVVFTGSGEKALSAGLDVNQMVKFPLEKKVEILELNDEVVRLMLNCDKTLVTANNGFAIGMGMILNLVSDFRLAVDDPGVFFQLPEIDIGLFPATGALSLAFHHFPPGVATRLVLGGERLSLGEARSLGFVHGVFQRGELERGVNKFVRGIARKNRQVLRLSKLATVLQRRYLLDAMDLEKVFARGCFTADLDVESFVREAWRKWAPK
ncbi:MAG: enoyl-CoA hydratase/isomerase family protein [Promethearchaeota archaeon]